jgi:hypothetical protein
LYAYLGYIDDADEVYFNGNSDDWRLRRIYEIPKNLLRSDKNIIAVRVDDYGGAGGIYEGPIGIMDEANMRHYKSKYHIGENWLKAIYNFFTE